MRKWILPIIIALIVFVLSYLFLNDIVLTIYLPILWLMITRFAKDAGRVFQKYFGQLLILLAGSSWLTIHRGLDIPGHMRFTLLIAVFSTGLAIMIISISLALSHKRTDERKNG